MIRIFLGFIMDSFWGLVIFICFFGTINAGDSEFDEEYFRKYHPKLFKSNSSKERSDYVKFYGPPSQSYPRCDYQTLISEDFENAQQACRSDCREIARVTAEAMEKYGKYVAVRSLYNQCHGLQDGICKLVPMTKNTWCLCLGENVRRPAQLCRFLIGAARVATNACIRIKDKYKSKRKCLEEVEPTPMAEGKFDHLFAKLTSPDSFSSNGALSGQSSRSLGSLSDLPSPRSFFARTSPPLSPARSHSSSSHSTPA